MKRYTFTFKGHGPFPLDMLRYDSCWPKAGSDVKQIEWSLDWTEQRKERFVTLEADNEPTIERWKSFGWRLVQSEARRAA